MIEMPDCPEYMPTTVHGVELQRVMTEADCQDYLGLYYALARDDMPSGREIAQAAEYTKRRLAAEMIGPQACLPYRSIISRLGTPAGFANLLPSGADVYVGVAVVAEYRRQRLASAAIRSLVQLAVQHGYDQVLANVRPGNSVSRQLLHRQGFADRTLLVPAEADKGEWLQMVWRASLLDADQLNVEH